MLWLHALLLGLDVLHHLLHLLLAFGVVLLDERVELVGDELVEGDELVDALLELLELAVVCLDLFLEFLSFLGLLLQVCTHVLYLVVEVRVDLDELLDLLDDDAVELGVVVVLLEAFQAFLDDGVLALLGVLLIVLERAFLSLGCGFLGLLWVLGLLLVDGGLVDDVALVAFDLDEADRALLLLALRLRLLLALEGVER